MSSRINFFFTEAVRSLTTNLATSVAATVTMLFTLLIAGSFALLVVLPAHHTAKSVGTDAGRVHVFLTDTITPAQLNALNTDLKRMPEVNTVTYVSKHDALVRAQKLFSNEPDVMKEVPDNTFPASLEATLKDPSSINTVVGRMQGQPGVGTVKKANPLTQRIIKVTHVIEYALVIGSIVLILVSVILVANTVRLSIFSRRREIEVMKLVGASNTFVRMPFVIEGFLCGLLAAVVACVLILGLVNVAHPLLVDLNVTSSVTDNQWTVAGLVLLSGIVLGSLGSGFTVRRYLRV